MLGKPLTKAPLLVRMERFTHRVAILIGVAALLMAGIALGRGMPLDEIFLLAVALAVSAIPEGLPVALTVALAIGMFLILGAVTVFVKTSETQGINENLGRLQENTRFVLELLENDIRLAGFWGRTNDTGLIERLRPFDVGEQRTVDRLLASTSIERLLSGFGPRERTTAYVRSTSHTGRWRHSFSAPCTTGYGRQRVLVNDSCMALQFSRRG